MPFLRLVYRWPSVSFDLGGQIDPPSHEQPQPQENVPRPEAAFHCRQSFRPKKKSVTPMIIQTTIDSILLLPEHQLGAPN